MKVLRLRGTSQRGNRGSLLLTVLILTMVGLLGVGSFLKVSFHDHSLTSKANDSIRAYHMAATGMAAALYHLNNGSETGALRPQSLIVSGLNEDDRLFWFTKDEWEETPVALLGENSTGMLRQKILTSYGIANGETVVLQSALQVSNPNGERILRERHKNRETT